MIRIEGIAELARRTKPAIERIDEFDWPAIGKELDQQGNAVVEELLSPEECLAIAGVHPNDDIFRSRVVMGRHGFGRGEYKYFSYPLPDLGALRTAVYPHLVPIANRWNEAIRAIWMRVRDLDCIEFQRGSRSPLWQIDCYCVT
jgi:hypothetical protein